MLRRPEAVCRPDGLELVWADGETDGYPWSWLRDACPCDECRATGGQQRRLDITTLRFPVEAPHMAYGSSWVELRWPEPGGVHLSTWALDTLRAWGASRASISPVAPERGRPVLCRRRWDLVRDGGPELEAVLEAVVIHGVALITGVPAVPEAVRDVVATFGYIRPTNYGEVFDVRAVVDPDNLANSRENLGPHTDNPYRDPVPSVQVLHCLRSSGLGGETIVVDGIAAAARLAEEDVAAYGRLQRWPWRWHWHDAANELEATGPVIACDSDGRVTAIRYNERSRLPALCPSEYAVELLTALARFASILADPAGQTRFRLTPGDAIIMDNRRLLHGRTAFASGGDRHLQGAYSDMDGLRSRLAVLRRAGAGVARG